MKPYLSVVIPAYNEEKRIASTILDIDKYLSDQTYPSMRSGQAPSAGSGQVNYEIILVSDGSRDNTVKIAKKLTEMVKGLRVIDNSKNHGKGYVVKQGMLEAKGKYRLFMDADNSTTINHLDKFWPYFSARGEISSLQDGKQGYDIVIGSIEVKGAKIREKAGWHRRLMGKYSKYLIRIMAGLWEIHDSQRGFKCFTDKAAEEIFPKQTIMRWGFDIEILSLAKKLGFKIKEVPIFWKNPPESKVTLKSYIRTFGELLKVKLNFMRDVYGIRKGKSKKS